jgi:hypothetical protein
MYFECLLFFNIVKRNASHEHTIGEMIGNYEIEKIIGRGYFFIFKFFFYLIIQIGSFGAVYLANDNETGISMAVKEFFSGDEKVLNISVVLYLCIE